jgi:CBS domain-containing protein
LGTEGENPVRIEELMTPFPTTCGSDDSLSYAAMRMKISHCGCIPVTDGCQRVVGMITDRDVCMAALLLGSSLKDIRVREVMTSDVRTCRPNDDLVEAQAIMQEARVRLLPVVNESEQLIGVISLTDLAREAERERGSISKAEIGKILATLSEPCDIDFEAVADEIDMMVGM